MTAGEGVGKGVGKGAGEKPGLCIRPYASADLEAVLRAWEAATALAHPFLSPEFVASERRAIAAVYMPSSDTRVAEVDGAVEGFVSLLGEAPHTEVGALFVHPSMHGRGVGRALMETAVAERGSVELEVFEANRIGRAFYGRYGFVEIGRRMFEPAGHPILRLRFEP